MQTLRPFRVAAVVMVMALPAALTSCGSSSDGSVAAGGSTIAPSTTGPTETTDIGGSDDSTRPATSAPENSDDILSGASLDEQSGPRVGDAVALLTAVRIAPHPGYDRVVFEFADDQLPEWKVAYAEPPFVTAGEGAPITLSGSAHLQVTMQGGSGFNLDTGEQTYNGPGKVAGGSAVEVADVIRQGDFEALLQWIVDSKHRVPFKVTALTGPSRLVIDLAHG